MNFNDFKTLVKNTRCVRRYKEANISYEDLADLVDIARQTSSGKNLQPLKYIIITDTKQKEEVYKPLVWAAHLQDWEQLPSQKPSAYILILEDTDINGFSDIDSGIAMQTIMLGARAKGLGSCILASIDKEAYKKLFNLPSNLEPRFIIAFGKQDEEIKITDIKDDTNYYRDENSTHFVPKRSLKEVLINKFN